MSYTSKSEYYRDKQKRLWGVNTGVHLSGLYTGILSRILEQIDAILCAYSRVICYRFDLHVISPTESNKVTSDFFKRLVPSLKEKYQTKHVGYFWVREQERAKGQHYHCVIFLDGSKVNNFYGLQNEVVDKWSLYGGNHIQGCGYKMLRRDDMAANREAFYWLSYLAKERGKDRKNKSVKRYGFARVTGVIN